MENRNMTIGAGGTGRIQLAGALPAGGGRPRAAANSDHDPFDLSAAEARLDRLLAEDAEAGGTPRTDVPQRGYYLSVYV